MSSTCCKVGDALDRYSLERAVAGGDVDDYLVARWRGEGEYRETGVRPLAAWFNRNILKSVYAAHGRTATTPRLESEHEALVGDDDIRRGEVLDDLRADGIDGEAVVADFVSPSTLYRHLRDCLSATKPGGAEREDGTGPTWERDAIAHVREAVRGTAEEAVRSLDAKGRIAGADGADVDVEVVLSCPDCSTKIRLAAGLERGYVCREHLGGPDDAPDAPADGGGP